MYVWWLYLADEITIADIQQLNYLTKYLELLDTVFLVLKKKPLSKDLGVSECASRFANMP